MGAESSITTNGAPSAPLEGIRMAIKIAKPIKSYRLATSQRPSATNDFVAAEDRRLSIAKVPQISGVLRWEKRPRHAGGNPSWTYMVDAPGGSFAVMVGHVEDNGHVTPFEVWAPGDGPRGMSALAQSISMDMRTRDRAWLRMKLESLARCPGDAFVMPMPNGVETMVPSEVAAFARLVSHRLEELGALGEEGEHPLVDGLMSKKEPKTTSEGTLSWTVDVANQGTGDDFTMFLKEATLPNGQRRPFSLWLAGKYPRSLDGLCKSLSLDMRVVDTGWILKKLAQLADAAEPNGGFMAQVPGLDKSAWYPSTVAYLAALVRHRFKVHGYCDEVGRPLGQTVLSVVGSAMSRRETKAVQGTTCHACGGNGTLISTAGCSVCVMCGWTAC